MKINYEYTFGLPRKFVWTHIKEESILKNSLTGCQEFKEISKGVYKAKVDIKLGPIQDVFTMDIRRIKEKSPSYYQLSIKGKGKLGEIDGNADLYIKESQGYSKIVLQAEAELTGSLAIVGKRMLESSANKGLGDFFGRVEKEIKRSLFQQKRRR